MDIDQASVFLAGSILAGLGFCIVGIVIVFLNNLFHKYWKPVKWFTLPDYHNPRYATQEELDAMDKKKVK